jgi:para-aminobenzoate synthetase/4-amino-4-deoxychorismate lyase
VGGGITWDSTATGEYDECRLKAAFLNRDTPSFELLESLRWDGEQFFLLREHLDRLAQSAAYFGYAMQPATILGVLEKAVQELAGRSAKVRLLLHKDGAAEVFAAPAPEPQPVVLRWAVAPVDDTDPFLFHKTTHRRVYNEALKSRGGADDVLLWNARGEVTESCLANVVVKLDGVWHTPPLSSGLLPGTMRGYLLESDQIREAVIPRAALRQASEIALINSVRGWIPVTSVLE